MLVRDIMSSPAVIVRPYDDVAGVTRILDRLNLTSLPVVDEHHRLVGIISEADVIGQLSAGVVRRVGDDRSDTLRVQDVMTSRVVTVDADDDIGEVVSMLDRTILKSVPVLLNDRVVGMLSRRDIVRAMAHGDLDGHSVDELSRA